MDKEPEVKELTLNSGEGTIAFRLTKDGLKVEMFDQGTIKDAYDFHDKNKLIRWLLDDIL